MTYTLENWSVCWLDPYTAPEANYKCLQGKRYPDERNVRTSPIKSVNGRVVTTESGSEYILGEPNSEFLKWMEENGIIYDSENPIKFKE